MKQMIYDGLKYGYGGFLWSVEKLCGIDAAKKLDVALRFRRKLDLKQPRTLADKVSWISLHGLSELEARCTDKWAVRDYVAGKGLGEILIPVCAEAVSRSADIDFDKLPEKFVLKATHGCGMNLICTDKSSLDIPAARRKMDRWLKTTYGTFSPEPHYRNIPHRVYAEECIADPAELMDYKIHCINGEPAFILVCGGRDVKAQISAGVTMDIFDLDWNWLDAVQWYKKHGPGNGSVPRPDNLEELLRVARILSKDFDFVRVDLYSVHGKVYFGELTFTPANGVFPSYKADLLEREGKKLTITKDMRRCSDGLNGQGAEN